MSVLLSLSLRRDTLKRVLGLPSSVVMEYKVHMDARLDNSSYRNTDVFQ